MALVSRRGYSLSLCMRGTRGRGERWGKARVYLKGLLHLFAAQIRSHLQMARCHWVHVWRDGHGWSGQDGNRESLLCLKNARVEPGFCLTASEAVVGLR